MRRAAVVPADVTSGRWAGCAAAAELGGRPARQQQGRMTRPRWPAYGASSSSIRSSEPRTSPAIAQQTVWGSGSRRPGPRRGRREPGRARSGPSTGRRRGSCPGGRRPRPGRARPGAPAPEPDGRSGSRLGPVPLDAERVEPPRGQLRQHVGVGRQEQAGRAGRGTDSRRHSCRHARAASIEVTRCSSTVGTISWSSVSLRPMRSPGAAARARATTSSGTGRSPARRRRPPARAPGRAASRRPDPRPRPAAVALPPQPQGARAVGRPRRPPDLGRGDPRGRVPPAVLERSQRVPEVQRAGSRKHAGDRTRHSTRRPGTLAPADGLDRGPFRASGAEPCHRSTRIAARTPRRG